MTFSRHDVEALKRAHGNNDYDLETISIVTPAPFTVGDTLPGRASFRNWLVHWADADTLLIAPSDRPTEWRPAHIHGRGGIVGTCWGFVLAQNRT